MNFWTTEASCGRDKSRGGSRVFDHMAVGIIEGNLVGEDHECAVIYDTVTEWAFGPIFKDVDEANAFLDYLLEKDLGDPRSFKDDELRDHYHEFLKVKDVKDVMDE
jgi:hypothetical protein